MFSCILYAVSATTNLVYNTLYSIGGVQQFSPFTHLDLIVEGLTQLGSSKSKPANGNHQDECDYKV